MADLTGMTLGPYRIVGRIGRGGMAMVYKAYHAAMDRDVAIKVLPEDFAEDHNFLVRFEREAKVVARLQHTNILPVFDYGQEGDTTYLVMPYIPTGTLKDYLAGGLLSLDEAARIVGQIAEAVDYAHGEGVLHRDLKPANVLMDKSNNALLSDFGLTRMIESASSLTGTGVIGTPAYMSPEQGQGKSLDSRSDIYSLGVMLYEMVVGEVPFNADTPVAVIFKHVADPLPMPRAKRPDLPQDAQNVILKSLAKDPGARFATSIDMAQAFRQTIAEQPVVAKMPSQRRVEDSVKTVIGTSTSAGLIADKETAVLPEEGPAPSTSPPGTRITMGQRRQQKLERLLGMAEELVQNDLPDEGRRYSLVEMLAAIRDLAEDDDLIGQRIEAIERKVAEWSKVLEEQEQEGVSRFIEEAPHQQEAESTSDWLTIWGGSFGFGLAFIILNYVVPLEDRSTILDIVVFIVSFVAIIFVYVGVSSIWSLLTGK